MSRSTQSTKILFVDDNEASFQIWQCIARALDGLPPLELVHAIDASDGLQKMDQEKPDVVVLNIDEGHTDEARAFVDSLFGKHPPVIVHAEMVHLYLRKLTKLSHIDKSGSLEGMHKTLLAATAAASRGPVPKDSSALH